MMTRNGFTPLPLDPPPPTPPRAIPNGRAPSYGRPAEYHDVIDIPKKQPQYQEIPYAITNGQASPPESVQMHQLSTFQPSDTEVDQALFMTHIPNSNSTAPLTEPPVPPPGERRPRKKANPLYDSFNDVVTTTSSTKKPPSKESCRTQSFRCIKHPITLFVIFLIVIANFIALLLLFTGTVEQVTPGAREKLTQTTPASGIPDQAELLAMIQRQASVIERLETRIVQLEQLLMTNSSENATTTARIAKNTVQIEILTDQVSSLTTNTAVQIQAVDGRLSFVEALSSSSVQEIDSLENQVDNLEKNVSSLNRELMVLNAITETIRQDVVSIRGKNTAQQTEIQQISSRINVVDQDFRNQLNIYNDSIYEDLETISKMQGPPGVNGSRGRDGADLSTCEYKTHTSSTGFSRDLTIGSSFAPDEGFVFTGVSCSTFGGTTANLKVATGGTSYNCECEGQTDAYTANARFCAIHYWQCPIAG